LKLEFRDNCRPEAMDGIASVRGNEALSTNLKKLEIVWKEGMDIAAIFNFYE